MQDKKNLVSIIIPNYNRESLIGETLDSIIAQTYEDWECVIVDDGSTDNSVEVIEQYTKKDSRIKLIIRPEGYPKGANACRNIGMKTAIGRYIIFFDSDDLMTKNHIESKINVIENGKYDYVVAKSEYFDNPENINPLNYRDIDKLPITANNFITKKINWITFDTIIKTELAQSISFTEKNQSAEEYNYFVKLVLMSTNAIFIDKILTFRRFHPGSYQVNLDNSTKLAHNNFYYYYDTYVETIPSNISKLSRQFLLNNATLVYYRNKKTLKNIDVKKLYGFLIKEFGLLKGFNKIYQIHFK